MPPPGSRAVWPARQNDCSGCQAGVSGLLPLVSAVSSDTITSVRKLSGMLMMPGLSRAMGAASRPKPYRSNILGERRIIVRADTIPTRIDAAMPLAVVFFQNRSMRIAGRFAEAATAIGLAWLAWGNGYWWLTLLGVVLLAVIWASTAFLQVPCHKRLEQGLEWAAASRLVRTNWIRTMAWTARGVLAILILQARRP